MEKCINEVFKDFDVNSNIAEAQIENINLYKKLNKLQIDIKSSKSSTHRINKNHQNSKTTYPTN